jgi:hypothetical protein
MNREVHVQFWEGVGLRCPALLAYLRAYESVAEARRGIAAYFDYTGSQVLQETIAQLRELVTDRPVKRSRAPAMRLRVRSRANTAGSQVMDAP